MRLSVPGLILFGSMGAAAALLSATALSQSAAPRSFHLTSVEWRSLMCPQFKLQGSRHKGNGR